MKTKICLLIGCVLSIIFTHAQNGKIIEKKKIEIAESDLKEIQKNDPAHAASLLTVNFFKITYLSDGLKVTAYIAEPSSPGKYPCIISNRGGNRDFGQWSSYSIAMLLGRMASWGYVVAASQYRGNDGGEGKEEFGGKDVDDVLNLIPVFTQLQDADTSRIGMEGTSRGGMMTYLALAKTSRLKAAVITAGMANAFLNIEKRPEMETNVFSELVPDYATKKDEGLKARSAVYWADKLCKKTPLLIMHGSADWRVTLSESLQLVDSLYKYKQPLRFIMYEGADHGISEFHEERFRETRRHFDFYLRDRNKLPNLELHGR